MVDLFFTSKRVVGDVGISLYSSTKEAISGFSRCLAKEYANYNITSNCIKLVILKQNYSKIFI